MPMKSDSLLLGFSLKKSKNTLFFNTIILKTPPFFPALRKRNFLIPKNRFFSTPQLFYSPPNHFCSTLVPIPDLFFPTKASLSPRSQFFCSCSSMKKFNGGFKKTGFPLGHLQISHYIPFNNHH